MLLRSAPNAIVVPFSPIRNTDFSGYTIKISPMVDFSDCDGELSTATKMNRVVEQEIMKALSQYMWLHRRFKHLPDGTDGELYE